MTRQIIIGLIGEGPTDYRFLNSIIRRTFELLAFECTSDLEILDIQNLKASKENFVADMLNASIEGYEERGISILCIHTDADAKNDQSVYERKIIPAVKSIKDSKEKNCKIVVPIVPVTMTESWMIADDDLFREEIGTNLTNNELGLNNKSESFSDPKQKITEAIRLVQKDDPRRMNLKIGELYLPIGQKANLKQLEKLPSYQKFKKAARSAFVALNLIHQKN